MRKKNDNSVSFEILVTEQQFNQINEYCEQNGFESKSEMINNLLIMEMDRRRDIIPGEKQKAYLKGIMDSLYNEYEAGKLMVKIFKEVKMIKEYVIAVHGDDKDKLRHARARSEETYQAHLLGQRLKTPWEFEDDDDPGFELEFFGSEDA